MPTKLTVNELIALIWHLPPDTLVCVSGIGNPEVGYISDYLRVEMSREDWGENKNVLVLHGYGDQDGDGYYEKMVEKMAEWTVKPHA